MTRSQPITILGLDPGLSNTGYAIAEVDPQCGKIVRTVELGLLTTERDTHAKIRRTSDDYGRARDLHRGLRAIIDRHAVTVAACEMVTTSKNLRPTLSAGICLGVVASLAFFLIQLLPREIKMAVTGNRDAPKEAMIRWALGITEGDDVRWPTSQRANKRAITFGGRHVSLSAEHQADALAAVQAAAQSAQLRELMFLQAALSRGR